MCLPDRRTDWLRVCRGSYKINLCSTENRTKIGSQVPIQTELSHIVLQVIIVLGYSGKWYELHQHGIASRIVITQVPKEQVCVRSPTRAIFSRPIQTSPKVLQDPFSWGKVAGAWRWWPTEVEHWYTCTATSLLWQLRMFPTALPFY